MRSHPRPPRLLPPARRAQPGHAARGRLFIISLCLVVLLSLLLLLCVLVVVVVVVLVALVVVVVVVVVAVVVVVVMRAVKTNIMLNHISYDIDRNANNTSNAN